MRLYNAICGWLEASAEQMRGGPGELHPEGNNFTDTQLGDTLPTRPALHIGYGRQSGDDDDGGVYRVARPISMRWTP